MFCEKLLLNVLVHCLFAILHISMNTLWTFYYKMEIQNIVNYIFSVSHEEHKLVQINWINSKLMNNDILNKQTTTTTKNERQPSTAIYYVRVGQELLIFPTTMTSISFIELIDFSVVVFFFWHCHLSSFFVRLCCQQLVFAHVQVQVQLLQKCIRDANASSILDEWNIFFFKYNGNG